MEKLEWKYKIAALAEVTGVLAAGNIISILISRGLGLARASELIATVPEGATPDYFALAGISAAQLFIKWGVLFGMAFLIGSWHRKRPLSAYGVSSGNKSFRNYLALGLLGGLLINLLPDGLYFLDVAVNQTSTLVPSQLPGRWTLGFWIFNFVGNFGLVPVFEELFFRGYYQTRLSEDLGAATAIWVQAFMFAFSHTRFIQADAFQLATLLSLILISILLGFMVHETRSLIPAIIAHAVINLPTTGSIAPYFLAFSFIVVLVYWKPIFMYARKIWDFLKSVESTRWTLLGIILVLAISLPLLFIPESLVIWAVLGLIVAIILEGKEKRPDPD